MTIEEKDFKLIPIDDHSLFFNLELLYTVKPRSGEPRKEFKNAAYGISLETAIKSIAQYRVINKHEDESISLKTYFAELKDELINVTNLCKL